MEHASPDDPHDRVVLALVARYLKEGGYESAYTALTMDAGAILEQVDVEGVASLTHVVRDYETLYLEKHGQPPELTTEPTRSPRLRMRPETIIGTTKLFGTTTPVSQADFFRVLCANPSLDSSNLFCIEMPLSCARRFRGSELTLTPTQEHVLYGLVGCADVGWRLSSLWKWRRYEITKRMLQLFFKNRCQQKQRRKRRKPEKDEPSRLDPSAHPELLETFVSIAPAPPTDFHVNSLLDMVKGEEFEGTPALIHSQQLQSYTPSAQLTPSEPRRGT